MKKIIGMIKPFDMKQNFYVYEDGNKLDSASPTIDEISETIFALMQEYDVSQLDLVGPKQYNKGLSKKIKEAEMVKYDKNTLEINIV
jgi:hypothetical protein